MASNDELTVPLRDEGRTKEYAWHMAAAFSLSWFVNWLLLGLKIVAFAVSHSKAVLASMADSAVDLASQLVISLAEQQIGQYDPRFPVGRARLEALAVIACACIMSIASLEVMQFAALDLYRGFAQGLIPQLDLSLLMFAILAVGTIMKFLLYLYCGWLQKRSDSMAALAEDHLNDVASNLGAIIAAVITRFWPEGWWVDSVGAILISVVIVARWSVMTYGQVMKIVGQTAPDEFKEEVEQLARGHHEQLTVDITRAYHFGSKYNVEMEIVLPANMTVAESHDIALALQHKIEALDEVERAFVHVDYQQRYLPEHRVERDLLLRHQGQNGSGESNHSV